MKKIFSTLLAIVMCCSVFCGIIPQQSLANEVAAVETGTAALAGERYTVDWVIPEIGSGNVFTSDTNGGAGIQITGTAYETLGYVSPKYDDDHATVGTQELVDGTVGSRHFLNDPWVGMYGNEENGIVIDLKNYYTNLSQVRLTILSSPENGIFLPTGITIAASADGITYNKVCDESQATLDAIEGSNLNNQAYYVPTEHTSVVYEVVFSPYSFSGTYVLIKFNHDVDEDYYERYWTFISEATVSSAGDVQIPDFSGSPTIARHEAPTDDPYNVNVALNSNYQIVGTVGTGRFADIERNKLVDSVLGGSDINNDPYYVSVNPSNQKIGIQMDLGLVQENITSFELKGYQGASYLTPSIIEFFASDDQETYYSVPVDDVVITTDGSKYTHKYTVAAEAANNAFSARYLFAIITVPSSEGMAIFDEFIVNNTNGSTKKVNYAPTSTYKYIENTVNSTYNDDDWSDDNRNEAGLPNLNVYSNGDLNNGIYATGTFFDNAWVAYNHASVSNSYVDIVFDLGAVKAGINEVNIKLLDFTNGTTVSNCSVPDSFLVLYSNDDTAFNMSTAIAGSKTRTVNINTSATNKQNYVYYTAAPNSVSARYIMLRIYKPNNLLFIDEVEIWSGNLPTIPEEPEAHTPINYGFDGETVMSAVWLDVWNVSPLFLYNGTYQVDEVTYRQRVSNYLTAMDNAGINTILLHARSHGDRFYGSVDDDYTSVSPFSKRYTGSITAVSTYDAFQIFLEEAHKKNLSVHGWVNPLRLGSPSDMNLYDRSLPIKQMQSGTYEGEYHTDYVNVVNNTYWLNIGYEAVRSHIVDSVMEIVNNYDVDGIVIDDYFYPSGATTAFDSECFTAFSDNGGTDTLGDFRRNNATQLMKDIYGAINDVKDAKGDIKFGISPAGNNISVDGGYYTSYNYTTMYADIRKWVEEEWDYNGQTLPYMDYLSPQLYWPTEALFATNPPAYNKWSKRYLLSGLLIDWADLVCESDHIKFMPSLGLYNAPAGAYLVNNQPSTVYKDSNIILEQLEFMYTYMVAQQPYNSSGHQTNKVRGQVLYNSATLYNDYSSSEGWYTDDYFTLQYSNDIRTHLKQYWQ